MARPKIPEYEKHHRAFRVRLKDDDANLVLAMAKKTGVAPNVLLRAMIRRQLPSYQLLQSLAQTIALEDGP